METYPEKDDSYPYRLIQVDHEINKKVSAISALDNIVCLGTEDGYLYCFDVKETDTGYGTSFDLKEI